MPPQTEVALKQRRSVFDNQRFRVFSDHIAAGSLEVENFLVVAPYTNRADLLTGIAIVPVREGSILLLKTYRHPVSQCLWELPRGFIDAGETPAEAGMRELTEETGLFCGLEDLVPLGDFFPDPGVLRARVGLFAALACHHQQGHVDDEIGIQDRRWHPEERVRAMLLDGSIMEGATCVALHRYFEWRRHQA